MADPQPRRFTVAPGDPFAIPLPFDPKIEWGRANAPVVVTVGAHSYRSTITHMGGRPWVPFRRSNRDAAGVTEGMPFEVTVALDTAPRTMEPPADLRAALEAAGARERWAKLSYTHQREHVEAIEDAKRPDTRARRIAACVAKLG